MPWHPSRPVLTRRVRPCVCSGGARLRAAREPGVETALVGVLGVISAPTVVRVALLAVGTPEPGAVVALELGAAIHKGAAAVAEARTEAATAEPMAVPAGHPLVLVPTQAAGDGLKRGERRRKVLGADSTERADLARLLTKLAASWPQG